MWRTVRGGKYGSGDASSRPDAPPSPSCSRCLTRSEPPTMPTSMCWRRVARKEIISCVAHCQQGRMVRHAWHQLDEGVLSHLARGRQRPVHIKERNNSSFRHLLAHSSLFTCFNHLLPGALKWCVEQKNLLAIVASKFFFLPLSGSTLASMPRLCGAVRRRGGVRLCQFARLGLQVRRLTNFACPDLEHAGGIAGNRREE